jgi:hypothetical protein
VGEIKVSTDQEGLEALNQIERTLQQQEAVRGLPNLSQICEQYRTIKPLVEKALGLIELIPIYGRKISLAIRFLTKVADMACPAASAEH